MDTTGLPYPKGTPRVVERHAKRRAAEAALRRAYAEVDERDKGICWATGRQTFTLSTIGGTYDVRDWYREHHHLRGRNVRPGWRARPERIVTLSRIAHQLVTCGWILVDGDDARRPDKITFRWNPDVKVRPIRLRRHDGKE